MRVKTIPNAWMQRDGRRFDCGPYMSGALEARLVLESSGLRLQPLSEVTTKIFAIPVFPRIDVGDPAMGVPLLGSNDILMADLSSLRRVAKKTLALSPKCIVREGMILLTSFGTPGRLVWARREMDGAVGSNNFMRIVADEARISPGYLYAFLGTKFGKSLILQRTSGSVVRYLLPQHIADLPVPRLGYIVEREAHRLIEKSARQRSKAASVRSTIVEDVTASLGWRHRATYDLYAIASSSELQCRLDAFHHGAGVCAARERLAAGNSHRLRDVVEEVFEPNRGARRKVEDPAHGVPFLSSSEVFRLDPVGDYLISRNRTPHLERQLVTERDLLLPRSGQLGGIIGRAVLPLPSYYGSAASEHIVRVRCKSREDAFFAWAVFATEPGYYAAIGTAFGSSIPSLDCALLAELRIPWWTGKRRDEIVFLVERMINGLADAIQDERDAIALVERSIEAAA